MVWNQKSKEVVGYVFAAVSLIVGFGLSIAGFIVPPTGVISESVLWLLSQTLVFSGAICGVSLHVDTQMRKVEAAVLKRLKLEEKEKKESESEKVETDNSDK